MATLPFSIADLNAVLGAYAREHVKDIVLDMLYNPMKSEKTTAWNLMTRVVVKDERAWAIADFDPEVQDADLAFNDQGTIITVDGRILKMRYMRSDFKIEVHKLYNSWLGHIESEAYHNNIAIGDLTAAMVAFGEWIFKNSIAKFMEKFMLKASFLGVHTPGFTAIPAESFGQSVDGFVTLVKDAIISGAIPGGNVLAAGGPLTSANTYAHYEALGESLDEKFYYDPMFLMAAVKNSRNYNKNFKSANAGNNPLIHDSYKRMQLEEADNVSIIPTPEMGSVDTSFITKANNMLWASNFDSMPPEIYTSVSDDPLVINATLRYGAGFGFLREDWVYTNDQ
jgi:hypothetical protein